MTSVKILVDRETRRSRGLAFVTMGTDDEGRKAMADLDGSTVGGRPIFVTVARPKEERPEAPSRPEDAPGFVERRSGKDRRKGWGPQPQGGERRGFGARKPFERKPWDKERKPFDRERKPWDKERKPFDRERKPWDKDRKPFDRERKPFDKERKPFDKDRKPFHKDRPPFGDRKKWGAGGPSSGQKPGQFKRRKPPRPR